MEHSLNRMRPKNLTPWTKLLPPPFMLPFLTELLASMCTSWAVFMFGLDSEHYKIQLANVPNKA